MSAFEKEAVPLAFADGWDTDTRVEIHTNAGPIVFTVHEQADQPMVDLLETPEGRTDGPLIKFLGTVASADALQEEGLRLGEVVRTYRVVLGTDKALFPINGKIEKVITQSSRYRKKL